MEKKGTIISLIFIAVIVACAVAFIIFSGITAKEYNYVQLEVNPRVEFILDKKFKVVSVNPLNSDARIVLSDMNLIGLDIEKASDEFLTECARAGFIDVNGVDNAVNITVIDGITQALDVHVTQNIYEYLRKNEILSSVTETYEDRHIFDEKKEHKICCSNKYKLLKTMTTTNPDLEFDTLKKMNEVNLIDIVAKSHKDNPYKPTEEEINLKQSLISQNKNKYSTHMKSITSNTQKEFATLFEEFQKSSTKAYYLNFEKEYDNWQK